MKSTGIVRRLDDLGRIVLPIEIRRTLDIADKSPLEIYVEGDSIILRKYESSCVFCGEKATVDYKNRGICSKCLNELSQDK